MARFLDLTTRTSWRDDILLKLCNVIIYVLFMGANAYTVLSPKDIYYTSKETYFTPAPWAYFIWALIHLLLLGTIIYQFTRPGKQIIIDGLGWRFPMLGIINAMYIYSWTIGEHLYELFFILFVSSSVTYIYSIIKMTASRNISDELFLHLPFSLYHGWSTVLVIVTAFEAFGVDAIAEPAGIWTASFVFLGLFFLEAASFAYASSSTEGDLPGCIAISWSLWAIFAHQTVERSDFVHWSALGFAILSMFWLLRSALGLVKMISGRRWLRGEERTSLLGGR
ncbi:hypothetical protein SERLA73DRAFT_181484 [Serpula lacrymans var. lacrymans S7.3]|uniref:Uncharacterized protein n=2 Tax=Serpula lacrymans var. lacrymans TaxID=341189 RepID=F8PY59_SERL3|nr:uncharacterized protein SERLADRAFT_467651 [Serpula lacrymans var. lacrymans S7.9]EGN98822.1 hypothetical protein SERLA73DRAFT_181484 [Serpula lacrymans var. lacrymans S7.3]EGO24413.1 hypothetical protein SERLADRAFT_467651 [Serpula lacrymans var. lacrymans S7.9]